MTKNVNLSIKEGDAFYCHEMSVNFNPLQFVLDFKSVTPRVDPRSQDGPSIVMKHNVVLMDPWHLKQAAQMLNKVVGDFEKQFGAIEKPKAVEIMEEKHKNSEQEKQPNKTVSTPTYFG